MLLFCFVCDEKAQLLQGATAGLFDEMNRFVLTKEVSCSLAFQATMRFMASLPFDWRLTVYVRIVRSA